MVRRNPRRGTRTAERACPCSARQFPLVIPEVGLGGEGKVGRRGRACEQEGKEEGDGNNGREQPFPERDHGRRTSIRTPKTVFW